MVQAGPACFVWCKLVLHVVQAGLPCFGGVKAVRSRWCLSCAITAVLKVCNHGGALSACAAHDMGAGGLQPLEGSWRV